MHTRSLVMGVSFVVHGLGALALVGWSAWKIETLRWKEPPPVLRTFAESPPAGPAFAPPAPSTPTPRTPARPAALRQPTPRQDVTLEPSASPAPADDTARGTEGPGDGTGEGLTPGGGGGGVGDGDPFAPPEATAVAPPVPPPAPPRPVATNDVEMEARRIAGDPRILLPSGLLSTLKAQGSVRFTVKAKVCVDEVGAPRSTHVVGSSGHPEVDAYVTGQIAQTWRFQPLRVNGAIVPACFVAVLRYSIL